MKVNLFVLGNANSCFVLFLMKCGLMARFLKNLVNCMIVLRGID